MEMVMLAIGAGQILPVVALMSATAKLIVPTQKVPTHVLVKKVGQEMGHRAQVLVCLCFDF